MKFLKLIFRNTLRHKLRTLLTIAGIAIAIMAFALLRTVVSMWYAGVEAAAADRLIVRHAVSFVFVLPYAYGDKIRKIPGVEDVGFATWFGGIYKDPQKFENFFPRMAIDVDHYLDIYDEFVVPPDQLEAFKKERNSCIVGRKTAQTHHLKIGDSIAMDGDIYPGKWEWVIRGIYTGKERITDETQMLFDWRYLDERMKKDFPTRAGNVGWYVVKVANMNQSASISQSVDATFKNSAAETKTETEKAFNQSFVSMYSAILTAMDFISFVIVGIILLVLANTMAMTARERTTEYAVLKTLGFSGKHLTLMVGGESLLLSMIGGTLGLMTAVPVSNGFQAAFPTMFPIMPDQTWNLIHAAIAAVTVGVIAALFPIIRVTRMRIVDGLRHID